VKKLIISTTVIACGAVGSALAADMPTKAPAMTFNDWSVYLGVNGGPTTGTTPWLYTGGQSTDPTHATDGWLFGGTVGVNYRFAPRLVAGIEADWDWSNSRGSAYCPNTAYACESKIDSLGTLRGRLGAVWWDGVLLYGTGGWAWTHWTAQTDRLNGAATPPSGTNINGGSTDANGWTAGFGLEWAFWNNWSVKAEYLYYQFPTQTFAVDNGLSVNASNHGNVFRMGLNYQFNWSGVPAGIVAKY